MRVPACSNPADPPSTETSTLPDLPSDRAISVSRRADTTTSAVTSGAFASNGSVRTAKRYRSVAARVIVEPSRPRRMPVSVGRVSSRPAATATWATAEPNSPASTVPRTSGSGGSAG